MYAIVQTKCKSSKIFLEERARERERERESDRERGVI